MPGMSGAQVLPELLRARPDIPVLLTSGHSESQTRQIIGEQRVAGFLQKPFSSQVLVSRVASAIGE